jgi:hypothetical protein
VAVGLGFAVAVPAAVAVAVAVVDGAADGGLDEGPTAASEADALGVTVVEPQPATTTSARRPSRDRRFVIRVLLACVTSTTRGGDGPEV